MLAIRRRWTSAFELAWGPYQKRGAKVLSVQATDGLTKVSLEALQEGASVAPGCTVRLCGEQLLVSLPARARLSAVALVGSRTIWDGTAAMLMQPTLGIRLPATQTLRLENNGSSWIFGLSYERPAAEQVAGSGFRPLLKEVGNILQSGLFHAALVVVVGVCGNYIHLPWLSPNETPVQEEQRISAVQKQQPVEVLTSSDSEFNGRGLVTATAEQVAQVQEKRQQKIATGLSDLVAKMAKVAVGNLGHMAVAQGTAGGSAVTSLTNQMGQMRKTDLRDNFKFVGQGTAGKDSKWDLSADKSKQVSAKDLEQVSDVFRSLQESFRGCYESALLKYEALAVAVQYEAEVTESGRLGEAAFSISGKSNGESESALKGCLSKVLHRVNLNKNLSGVRIRNQFVFRS
jgi:hypothetical protein